MLVCLANCNNFMTTLAEDIDTVDAPPMPWDTLFPKQVTLFNAGIQDDSESVHPNSPVSMLVEGPRKSSKTIGVCHRVLRHMWETPNARVALIVKTTGSATDGGVWLDLVDIVMPIWVEANFGFEWATFDREGHPGPKTDSKTRTIYFRIRNYFGGESELRLISLEHDHQVKQRLKSSRFSCIWFSELSNFRDQKVFTTSWQQLRMYHLKPWQHLWVGDTNPSDEGEASWIYQLWFKRKGDLLKKHPSEFAMSLRKITFLLRDNLSLSEDEIQVLGELYSDDPGEYAREFEGKWVAGHGNRGKHFADIFSRFIHVIGEPHGNDAIELHPNTDTLFTGWDIGGSVNHAAGIMEKRVVIDASSGKEYSVFSVIDSIKHTDEQMSVSDLGLEMLEKMEALELLYGKKFDWVHWSDDTAINVWRPSSGTFDYLEIQIATEGRIVLNGVYKPDRSVEARVRLGRRLLRENRIYVSGKCMDVILMFENLKRGTSKTDVVQWSEHKHVWDWISYVLFMECQAELELMAEKPSVSRRSSDLSLQLA